jgi:nitroreductase
VDTRLAIMSRREVRRYSPRLVPDDAVRRILAAGRVCGSARNRQPWRFVVVRERQLLDALADTVSRNTNVLWSNLLVVIVLQGERALPFDGGRVAQNMMLAAWNEGIGSVPNGFVDGPRARELLELQEDQELLMGITFGYPETPRRDPDSRTPEEWAERANLLPLDDLVLAWR